MPPPAMRTARIMHISRIAFCAGVARFFVTFCPLFAFFFFAIALILYSIVICSPDDSTATAVAGILIFLIFGTSAYFAASSPAYAATTF